jgi:serine/threonine protein kinase
MDVGSEGCSAGRFGAGAGPAVERMVFNEQWQDTICEDEPLRPGTRRFGLRVLARLAGDARRGVELGADPTRGDLSAIKFTSTSDVDEADVIARIQHEHHVLRTLDHPNVRRSFGCRLERRDRQSPANAVLLRFVDGATLDRWESPELPELCQAMSGVCRALAHVHERGWVHGDLRPRHVIVDGSDRPVVISFGRAVRAGVTFDASPVPHPYAAPERIDGGVATPRADVFGVGATLAALLLRHPLPAISPGASPETRRRQHESWAEELAGAGVHTPLCRLVLKAMHPDPLRRPAFIEAIGSHLADLADTLAHQRRLAA